MDITKFINAKDIREIFIGGSKSIGKLNLKVEKVLDRIIRNNHNILIGDCYGADLAVQRFLSARGYKNVTVYTACKMARNNAGWWNESRIPTEKTGFSSHRQKDIAMIKDCDFGIMIWDGKSKGTFADIEDMEKAKKKVVVLYENIRCDRRIIPIKRNGGVPDRTRRATLQT